MKEIAIRGIVVLILMAIGIILTFCNYNGVELHRVIIWSSGMTLVVETLVIELIKESKERK